MTALHMKPLFTFLISALPIILSVSGDAHAVPPAIEPSTIETSTIEPATIEPATIDLSAIEPSITRLSRPETQPSILEDLLIPRKQLPFSILGVNAFANDQRFGSIRSQFREVRGTLGIRDIRVLFAWNDQIQPTPNTPPFWGFYDEITRSLPPDVRVLVVLTGIPTWMQDPKNWKDNNPRTTFVEQWVAPVITRYRSTTAITSFQIWNEPNNPSFPENLTLGVLTSPENYVELQSLAYQTGKRIAPRKRVINGATTALAQNFPGTFNYNKEIINRGILRFTDAFAIHYYGKNVDKVVLPNGIRSFLRSLNYPIWITEIGKQGTTSQLEYAQRLIPFLLASAPRIQKVFIYQFTEATPANITYGLRNLTPGRFLSDLYIHLRNRALGRNLNFPPR